MEVKNENEYALYQQDTFLSSGTLKEISEETGISIKQLRYYSFDSYTKKCLNGKRLIKLEVDKLTKKQCERFAFMWKQNRLEKKNDHAMNFLKFWVIQYQKLRNGKTSVNNRIITLSKMWQPISKYQSMF